MLHAVIQQKDMSYVEWKKKYLEHIRAGKYKPTAMKVSLIVTTCHTTIKAEASPYSTLK